MVGSFYSLLDLYLLYFHFLSLVFFVFFLLVIFLQFLFGFNGSERCHSDVYVGDRVVVFLRNIGIEIWKRMNRAIGWYEDIWSGHQYFNQILLSYFSFCFNEFFFFLLGHERIGPESVWVLSFYFWFGEFIIILDVFWSVNEGIFFQKFILELKFPFGQRIKPFFAS